MSSPGIARGFTDEGRCVPDNLIAGEFPRVGCQVSIIGTQPSLPLGAVLGEYEPGVYCLSRTDATEGSQVPAAILAEAVVFADNQAQALIYLSGEFQGSALFLGHGHTLAAVTQALRLRSIFIR